MFGNFESTHPGRQPCTALHNIAKSRSFYNHYSYMTFLLHTAYDKVYKESLSKDFFGVFLNAKTWKEDQLRLGKDRKLFSCWV